MTLTLKIGTRGRCSNKLISDNLRLKWNFAKQLWFGLTQWIALTDACNTVQTDKHTGSPLQMPATQYRLTNTLDHPYWCLQHSTDWQTAVLTDRQTQWITITDACNTVQTDKQQFWQTDKHCIALTDACNTRTTVQTDKQQFWQTDKHTGSPLLMPATPGPQHMGSFGAGYITALHQCKNDWPLCVFLTCL